MAVMQFVEIHNGREGGATNGVRDHTRIFRVRVSSVTDDQVVILNNPSAPKEGDEHNTDPEAWCVSVKARQDGLSRYFWTVTALYSSDREKSDNPLNDPAEWVWDTQQYQKVAEKDRDGKAILNSAGDPFDPPPMMDDSRRRAVLTMNVAPAIATWVTEFKDAINDADVVIDGMTVTKYFAKCQKVSVGKVQVRNDIEYRVVTLTIDVKDEDDPDGGWILSQLDRGFRALNGSGSLENIVNEGDGKEVTVPALLDGNGYELANPSPDTAVFIDSYVYKELDFSILPGVELA